MPYKDKKMHAAYCLKRYHANPENKMKHTDNHRLNYWRKKFAKLIGVKKEDTEKMEMLLKLSEEELRTECYCIESEEFYNKCIK